MEMVRMWLVIQRKVERVGYWRDASSCSDYYHQIVPQMKPQQRQRSRNQNLACHSRDLFGALLGTPLYPA